MPRISTFYGIVVTMYSSDHAPPHFHARYGEHEAKIAIDTGDLQGGSTTGASITTGYASGQVSIEASSTPTGSGPRRANPSLALIHCHER